MSAAQGLHFLDQLDRGTFLKESLDVEGECRLSTAELDLILLN
jgi:hypothetical protein